jgi:hypothetical protein
MAGAYRSFCRKLIRHAKPAEQTEELRKRISLRQI